VGVGWGSAGRQASEPRHRGQRCTALPLFPSHLSQPCQPRLIMAGFPFTLARCRRGEGRRRRRVVRSCSCRPCGPGRGGDPNLVPPARGVPALRSARIIPDRKALATPPPRPRRAPDIPLVCVSLSPAAVARALSVVHSD
jgi:hypothetical protein